MILNISILILLLRMFFSREHREQSYNKDSLDENESEEDRILNQKFKIKLQQYEHKMQQRSTEEKFIDPEFIKYKELMVQQIINKSTWSPNNLKKS